jgi:hypothetical protein
VIVGVSDCNEREREIPENPDMGIAAVGSHIPVPTNIARSSVSAKQKYATIELESRNLAPALALHVNHAARWMERRADSDLC